MRLDNWNATLDRFEAWWNNDCIERPMLRITAVRNAPTEALEPEEAFTDARDRHLNVQKRLSRFRNFLRTHRFMAEGYPNFSIDIGPGSMALYIGSEPEFHESTVWFQECLQTEAMPEDAYRPDAPWFLRHLNMAREARDAAGDDFFVNIPDIVENIDIYAALRGPQAACFDLIDAPDVVKRAVAAIDDAYMKYYQAFYDIVHHSPGLNAYTAFNVVGLGRIAKIQCDFCALMSPGQFREFVLPSLTRQARVLDRTVYHLDGPDAIKHMDALMEIRELNALQWTCGAGQPDSGSERWFPIYTKAKNADKALHLSIYDGDFEQWIRTGDDLVARYGAKGTYFLFPTMTEAQAYRLIDHAHAHWKG